MNAIRRMASLTVLMALGLLCLNVSPLMAQAAGSAAGGASGGGQKYTMAEYNAYTAAANEKNLQAQLKELDDFVAKYPNSALLNYVYPLYYQNYAQQKNYPKVVEYADKELALGDKLSPTEKYQAYSARAFAFNNTPNPDPATAKAAYQAALDGAKSVDALPKPEGIDQAKFDEDKKKAILNFNGTAANAAMDAKDYPNAIQMYKTILATSPDDFISNFNIGRADLAVNPPQQLDALWYFARAASSKTATDQQSKSVKAYMPKVIQAYQGGTVCDAVTNAELNQLLQLAATTQDRPATWKLPSSADLDGVRKDMTIASVVTDLKGGGDKATLTWTAACGLEFPDVPGKIIDVTSGPDTVVLHNAFVTSDAEFQAATTPDMEVTIKTADQPDAAKLEKGNAVRFTGTLESYDPAPAFLLHWDKAKVNEEDLPKAGKKAAPSHHSAKPQQ
jgi:tetratricopeptide (TPR) repeat protein